MSEFFYDNKSETYFKFELSEYVDNPRDMRDYNSKFVTFERNWSSPDKNEFENFESMLNKFGTKHTGHMRNDLDNLEKNALKKGYIVLPVWKYEHSGVAYRASERYPFHDGKPSSTPGYEGGWDGGLCGVIYEKRDRRNIEEVKTQLKNEVEEYSRYVEIEGIYDITKYDKNGEELDTLCNVWADEAYPSDKEMAELVCDYMGHPDVPTYIGDFNDIEEAIEFHQKTLAKEAAKAELGLQKPLLTLQEKLDQAKAIRESNPTEPNKTAPNKEPEI